MSFPMMAAIFKEWEMLQDRHVGPTARFVLLALANRMNQKSGRCDPSYEQLAQDTGFSRSSVSAAIDQLWHQGLVDWTVRRKVGSKENASNLYVIPGRPDPADPKGKIILQPADPRPLSQEEQDMATAKADRRAAKAKTGNRTVNGADESPSPGLRIPATGLGIPATGKGIPASGLKPGTQPGKKQEGNGNVVVGGGAPPHIVEGDPLDSPFEGERQDGNGSGDDPVEQGEGETEGTDMDGNPHHHRRDQDEPDPVNGDGVGEGEGPGISPVQPIGDGNVGDGGGNPPRVEEGDPLDSPFSSVRPDGNDLSDESVEQRQGHTEPTDPDFHPDGGGESMETDPTDFGDSPDGTVADPGAPPPLEPEYLPDDFVESEDQPSPPARPKGSLSTDTRELALFYFGLLGEPVQLKGRGRAWEKDAVPLLKLYTLDHLKGMATYALNHEFWRAKMLRFGPMDPFKYFASKAPELFQQIAAAERARTLNPKSEATHGRKKTRAELNDEQTRAAGERVKARLRGEPG